MRYWLLLPLLLLSVSVNAETCPDWVAKAISIQGTVELRETNNTSGKRWTKVKRGHTFCANDIVRVKNNSCAAVILTNDTILRLAQNSTITFANISATSASTINLSKGIAHFISRVKQAFEVVTPFVNAAVEGTEFVVAVNDAQSAVTVFEGKVRVSNQQGEVLLTQNQSASASKGRAPILKTIIKPRDAVQWALYYPIIIDRHSVSAKDKQNIINAANKLSSGQVTQASQVINEVLESVPQQSEALALKAIIALVNNDKAQALMLATKALESDSQNVSALLAMSYVQQANFDIQAALNILTNKPISNALVHTRLSELNLMLGQLDEALEQAKQAVVLNAELSKTQSVLGFAYLTQIEVAEAEKAFNKAIELDQTEPLARLGLGLALIRQGQLEQGRREIEYAASLDPNNALIRSYLGKAYYEENRNKVASSQFDMAKELDPNDPTAWLYSAIQKQSTNRPVEGLRELESSIEKNNNRAIYRSQFLLDADEGARSSNLGALYKDLGFEHLALLEAWKSVNENPLNYSAHQLLADTYSVKPRHEFARVNEAQLAQILRPKNLKPVSPINNGINLGILNATNIGSLSFNEYSSLFDINKTSFRLSGLIGSNETSASDISFSGVENNSSFNVGAYHYQTDGFRDNNDQKQSVYYQNFNTKLSNSLSFGLNFSHTDIERGDLGLLATEDIDPSLRETEEVDSITLTFNKSLNISSKILSSFGYQDATLNTVILPGLIEVNLDIGLYLADIKHIYVGNKFNISSGIAYRNKKFTDESIVFAPPVSSYFETKYYNAYVYSNIKPSNNLLLTFGGSVDSLSGGIIARDKDEFNPKLGAIFDLNEDITVRAAYFETLQRPRTSTYTVDPSLEQTQVAGFNQLYDSLESDNTKNTGFAVDYKVSESNFVGLELIERKIDTSVLFANPLPTLVEPTWEEKIGRFYWNSVFNNNFSLSIEYLNEKFDRESSIGITGAEQFIDLDIKRIPVKLNYFSGNKFKASLIATQVDQDGVYTIVDFTGITTQGFSDKFWVFDAVFSYKLPNNNGVLSLEGKNISNQSFIFQDTDPVVPTIYPERYWLLKFALHY